MPDFLIEFVGSQSAEKKLRRARHRADASLNPAAGHAFGHAEREARRSQHEFFEV